MAICDDCGKNFFAFKLSEQAVPSRFLSVAPDNSQVSLKLVSCQQRGVPDQLIQYTELRSTGGSMDSEPRVHSTCTDVVVNQNFGREDTSTVPNAAGSCNLQMLGKRKHDDCADSGRRRDSCINKRQSKDNSLSDTNSTADKMYNDDVVVANSQAAKHVPDTRLGSFQ